ncbi:aldose 1-epimerase family protein [Companilactobacillus ginsenosidimutans]|uniref:Aldose epimerase n=1 Tax=Companilactobacillus ginsenosidimutans TaxID=1007676 RepID=A0A0H4QDX9_9LACO|nr:aldose 1-epimerase family protein [Companilactobacillus ginsenosidimutans]AKP66544.1 aldose epimerase [Companilactobacillus ginsenosidimutans]
MEVYSIQNDFLSIKVKSSGAEIISIQNQANQELIWQADPEVWNRHAPVLFPIVGRLNGDHYYYNDQKFQMSQHGFARDKDFEIESQTDSKLILSLEDDQESYSVYPFHFKLQVIYQLVKDTLQVSYIVKNKDSEQTMYFAVGAHPGFAVPFVKGLSYEDFKVSLTPKAARSRISLKDANIDLSQEKRVDNQDFNLTHEEFVDDAIIYSLSEPTVITISSDKTDHKINLDTGNAKFVGIWSQYPTQGDFVCIEPWWGIADKIDTDHQLTTKYGINTLDPEDKFEAYYSISFK